MTKEGSCRKESEHFGQDIQKGTDQADIKDASNKAVSKAEKQTHPGSHFLIKSPAAYGGKLHHDYVPYRSPITNRGGYLNCTFQGDKENSPRGTSKK